MKNRNFIIGKEDLLKFLKDLNLQLLFSVKTQEKISFFAPCEVSEELFNLQNLPTTKPLKNLFFPQVEYLFSFRLAKNKQVTNIQSVDLSNEKKVIFGVPACEAKALRILDNVFSWDYKDDLYFNRRENFILIVLACESPQITCFCKDFYPQGPLLREGDIFLIEDKDYFFAEILSEKVIYAIGDSYKKYFKELDNSYKKKKQEREEEILKNFPKKDIDLQRLKRFLDENFEHPAWEELAEKCIGCGICTYLCPTCHCFDITDETIKQEGKRLRTWDSCSFPSFTKMPAHQPRDAQYKRLRQRIMHKFKYFVDRFNEIACVGCGRCIKFCPVNINIISFIQSLYSSE